MNNDKKLIYAALSAAQFALFGLIPKSLRAINIVCKNLRIDLFFYCHGELSEQEKEMIMIDIEGEFSDGLDDDIFHFFGPLASIKFYFHIIRLDRPACIPKIGYLAYKCYEPEKFNRNDYSFLETFKEDLALLYKKPLRSFILIAAQKALLNRIGENLREVDVAWNNKNIWFYFYYDNAITDLDRELANTAAQEFMQSFPDYKFEFKILLSNELDKYASEHDWVGIFSRGKLHDN